MEGTGCAGANAAKRGRDGPEEAPEAKRIRPADLLLLDILDDTDRSSAAPADGDLATVMRSLEEEITSLSPPPPPHLQQQQQQQPAETPASDAERRRDSDLGYLLEASDDELGLPPTVPSSEEGEGAEQGDLGEDGNYAPAGFGPIWDLDDEIPSCYGALGFGVSGPDGGDFDGGLFEYADVAFFGASDFSGFSWQPESMPAV